MEELKVVGKIIDSDILDVSKIDGTIGNRSFEDTRNGLTEMDISEGTIDRIEFYSHLRDDGSADILGDYNGRMIGIEAKGVAPSKTGNKSNFKYWSKGIIDQMLDISDATDCDIVGIAIPENCADTLRGILSSHHDEIDDQMAREKEPEELYGERKSEKLKLCRQSDLMFLVGEQDIEVRSCREFFGL